MFLPEPLPRTLFEEIGKIVAIWATIEQNVVLHASALAARDTDGRPEEYLRMDFRRLRETWYGLCRDKFDVKIFNRQIHPFNMEMARLSLQRGYIVHGMWKRVRRGHYRLHSFEQKTEMAYYEVDISLRMIREIRHDSYLLAKRFHQFLIGEDGSHDGKRPILKSIAPVVPPDKG